MSDGFITWVLAILESASLSKHLVPKLSKLYNRYRYRKTLDDAQIAFLDDPYAQFVARPCSDEHMAREIFKLRNNFFPEATDMSEATMLNRFRHCPDAFHVTMRLSPAELTASLEGYYVLIPITDDCVAAISQGQIEAGRHIRESDIVTDKRPVHAAYISVVCGNGPRAQLATVNSLIGRIDLMRRQRGLRLVFVRPTTFEGSYALRRHAGRDFPQDGRIQRLDLTTQKPSMTFPRRRLVRS